MPHLLRKKWNQLKEGDEVKLKGDPRIWEITSKTGGANFTVETLLPELTEDGEAFETKEVNFSEDYEANWVYSQDCQNAPQEFTEGWDECERHYGIGHLGSGETDPIRQLALAILRGDQQACDAVRKVIQ